MKVVALISGGKDSCYNMMQCVAMGHEIVALANLEPLTNGETDSYMYQTVGSEAIEMYSDAMQLPLYRRKIQGYSKLTEMTYKADSEDEVEDLYLLLKEMKSKIEFSAVSCGAILSDYQRVRVENVCSRLSLCSLSYLWRRDQKELLKEMIDHGVTAILIKTAALGLIPKLHLGKSLSEVQEHLLSLNSKYGSHVCGEGGEYETFTLDCPLFKKRICIDNSEVIMHADDCFAPVAYLHLKSLHLEDKNSQSDNLCSLIPNMQNKAQVYEVHEKQPTDSNEELIQWLDPDSLTNTSSSNSAMCWESGCYLSVSGLIGVCKCKPTPKEAQICAKDILLRLLDLLKVKGHEAKDVLYVHLYISDMSLFNTVNMMYKQFFTINPPARVCVSTDFSNYTCKGESTIPFLQLDVLSHRNGGIRKVMHVQGISHWAPANIGPYSQCVMQSDVCFVAGQIGLVPGSMELVKGGINSEASLALQHVESILNAMDETLSVNDIIQCVCYVTDDKYVPMAQAVWRSRADKIQSLVNQVTYVVVQSLPRKAAIEWQIVAARPSPCSDMYNIAQPFEGENATGCVFYSDKAGPLDPIHELRCLLDKLKTYLEEKELNLKNVIQIRLFVVKRNLMYTQLQDIPKYLLSEVSLPSICVIPVKKIYKRPGSKQLIMSMICLMTDHPSN